MKYSLVNLLLILTTAAAFAGLYGAWRSNSQTVARFQSKAEAYEQTISELRDALRKLKQETGQLTIEEKTNILAVKMQTDSERTWKYRVFLPEGHNYYFGSQINSLPVDSKLMPVANDPPGPRTIGILATNSVGVGVESGEFIVALSISKTNDDWRYRLQVNRAGEAGTGRTGGSVIQCEETEWPNASDWTARSGVNNQEAFSVDDGCLLLDFRAMPNSINESAKSKQGAILWVTATD